MFYILSEDFRLPPARRVTYPSSVLRISYFLGKEIPAGTPNVKIEVSNRRSLLQDSLVNSDKLLVFNLRLVALVVNNSQDPVQVCPVDIVTSKPFGSESAYKLVIPLAVLSCIDEAHSDIVYSQNNVVVGMNKLRLDSGQVVDHDFFRIREYPALTVVSERLASVLIAERISGIKLIPVDELKI
jgi:hypothetical protein